MRILLVLVGIVMVATSVVLLLTAEPEIPREVAAPAPVAVAPTAEAIEPSPVDGSPTFLDRDLEVAPSRQAPEPEPDPVARPPREAPDEPEPAPVARPTRIEVDAIGVDHPVISVGLNPDGSMEIPHDVHELGWYEPGVMPGEFGSAVIAGHVDSRQQGPGAFFDLRLLEAGDAIEITDESGITRVWNVDRVVRYHKDSIPMEDLFRWDGDSADLVLVTCGGAFDRTRRSYEDNIVVYASG